MLDVSRGLRRASLRASAARSCLALTAVPPLTPASLAMAVGVASGLALSAARARSRASVDLGARRLYFRRRGLRAIAVVRHACAGAWQAAVLTRIYGAVEGLRRRVRRFQGNLPIGQNLI